MNDNKGAVALYIGDTVAADGMAWRGIGMRLCPKDYTLQLSSLARLMKLELRASAAKSDQLSLLAVSQGMKKRFGGGGDSWSSNWWRNFVLKLKRNPKSLNRVNEVRKL